MAARAPPEAPTLASHGLNVRYKKTYRATQRTNRSYETAAESYVQPWHSVYGWAESLEFKRVHALITFTVIGLPRCGPLIRHRHQGTE